MNYEIFNIFDAVFFISITTLMVGLVGLLVRHCLRSRCEHFTLCWGFITIDRRVDLEVQEEMSRIEHGISTEEEPSQHPQLAPQIPMRRPSFPDNLHKDKDNKV